jgi:Subtilase family
MPDRPLLVLPAPGDPVERGKKTPAIPSFHRPGRSRQVERLAPRFEQLQQAFAARRARLHAEAQGFVPEEVLVLETVGTVDGFLGGVERIPGMEWLGEIEEEDIPPDDDFFAVDRKRKKQPGKALAGRVFMVFTNQDALREMLSLWTLWREGRDDDLPRGLRSWRRLFEQLRDLRRWGVRDRLLETGVLDDWQDRVSHGQEIVPCEIELWYRQTPRQRLDTRDRITRLVRAQEGRIAQEAVVEEIAYHALLAYLPIGAIRPLLDDAEHETELIQCEHIQFFRASGQMAALLEADERHPDVPYTEGVSTIGSPVVALLDGLPLQVHRRLNGRLIIDDPDDFEAEYLAHERRHGTGMASLILHGDLAAAEDALVRPLYVRPILRPDSRDWHRTRRETVSEDTLVVDLIHRAVRRLYEGEGDEPPVAPDIAIVNLSIGIRDRLFDSSLSPLARLLDWLAWRYQVLFVVSAGNHPQRIELPQVQGDIGAIAPAELQSQVIRAIASDARQRRLLSPAEGLNVLTVGALNDDASADDPPPRCVHPFVAPRLPSPINAQGMGYRRAIKPDLLAPGGRIVLQEYLGSAAGLALNIYNGTLPPGQSVAAPGPSAGDTNWTWCTRGTSNATALVSRGAAMLYDVLDELRNDIGGEIIESIPRSVWLKALLTHGADWASAGSILAETLRTPENSRRFKEYLTRLLGYGAVNVERVRECAAFRATAIGGGYLTENQSHHHRFPLPPSLSGQQGYRRLTITLAWLTPVNPRHQSWRRADLWFAPPKDQLKITRQQADWRAVQRGTIQHEILEGNRAAVFVDGTNLDIQVSCRGDAGVLEEEVPYALVTTLEVAEEIGVPIYDEIKVRVQSQVQVAASS